MKTILLFALLTVFCNGFAQVPPLHAVPVNLTCNYRSSPIGLDERQPRLSWNIQAAARNWHQRAYQIMVATDSAGLLSSKAVIWNSGKVQSTRNLHVKYAGSPLRSFMNCWWRVRVWDAAGKISSWSAPAYWKMGVLEPAHWKAQWVASNLELKAYQVALRSLPDFDMEPETSIWRRADSIRKHVRVLDTAQAVHMRRVFTTSKKIRRATAYVCGLGLHELYLNGRRVGKEYLNPAHTDYQKTVFYNTYNVTAYIKTGRNALGVILGNGWYNGLVPHALRFYTADYIDPPKLMMQLRIEYADGSVKLVGTDKSWQYTTRGPIYYNDILSGESYDARSEMPGWSTPGYAATNWEKCLAASAPSGKLVSQQLYPVTKIRTVPAVSVSRQGQGFRFDLGQDLSGWVRLRVHGKRGQQVKIHYLGSGGHTLGRYQTHYYILKGGREEWYEPRFSYNGFRLIEVEGLDYSPECSDVQGVLVATELKKTGTFACSNDKLNRLQQTLLNTIDNFVLHIPNDPTREKAGWLQDTQNGFDVNAYNYDVASMYRKWQRDFNDIAFDNGYVPPVAPGRFAGPSINGPWWGGMILYNVAMLHHYYGDEDIIRESYAPMKRWMAYLQSISKDHVVEWGLGEWMEPAAAPDGRPTTTPVPLTSTVAYYFYACKMAEFARLLEKPDDVSYFTDLAKDIKTAYNRRFLDAATGRYALGSQAGQLMSLRYGLVPDDKRGLALERLREYIAKQNGHLSTGFVATPVLLTTLSDLGMGKEAYAMATKEDYPGWFDMVFNKGNSVLKEAWNGGLVQMPSLAGPIGHWFYHSLAGIQPAPGAQAFGRIVIKPTFISELSWVEASYQSAGGKIFSHWKHSNDRYEIRVTIPANTTALVYLPAGSPDGVTESGTALNTHKEISIRGSSANETVLALGSGSYRFSMPAR
ncbi:hypothetical protein C7T94_08600 [Pedobacter yulinensis]|uniref:alpha-L-rhamnosidase n=1 Tax=Pedobacter yulinensis TaxID=2126353 RepID=A0A2T3HJS1_9SPHI|nr:family 78 glycoside hydrolase catalytic domain [Pedobacter yulinensis]PST82705.1 hypothetical protein C7T94_08600 [Pedobacter yulinensis]